MRWVRSVDCGSVHALALGVCALTNLAVFLAAQPASPF
jgi:hypothetical protein